MLKKQKRPLLVQFLNRGTCYLNTRMKLDFFICARYCLLHDVISGSATMGSMGSAEPIIFGKFRKTRHFGIIEAKN